MTLLINNEKSLRYIPGVRKHLKIFIANLYQHLSKPEVLKNNFFIEIWRDLCDLELFCKNPSQPRYLLPGSLWNSEKITRCFRTPDISICCNCFTKTVSYPPDLDSYAYLQKVFHFVQEPLSSSVQHRYVWISLFSWAFFLNHTQVKWQSWSTVYRLSYAS